MLKNHIMASERGSVILMTMMVFLILSILAAAIVSAAGMEGKISHYAYRSEQAQQAADAGVEWARAEIYSRLEEQKDQESLPDDPLDYATTMEIGTEADKARIAFSEASLIKQSSQDCTYGFTSTGSFQGAKKAVTVQIRYSFTENRNTAGEFLSRTYRDRGRIMVYNSNP